MAAGSVIVVGTKVGVGIYCVAAMPLEPPTSGRRRAGVADLLLLLDGGVLVVP